MDEKIISLTDKLMFINNQSLTQQKEAIEKEQEDLSRADLYAKGYADGVKETEKEWVDKIIKLLADSNCTQDPSLIRHYIKELII